LPWPPPWIWAAGWGSRTGRRCADFTNGPHGPSFEWDAAARLSGTRGMSSFVSWKSYISTLFGSQRKLRIVLQNKQPQWQVLICKRLVRSRIEFPLDLGFHGILSHHGPFDPACVFSITQLLISDWMLSVSSQPSEQSRAQSCIHSNSPAPSHMGTQLAQSPNYSFFLPHSHLHDPNATKPQLAAYRRPHHDLMAKAGPRIMFSLDLPLS
jgi:hypothetical protein